ncbi:SGNH/GDSL hydrolase family protein [Labilibaculum sp.]|uniref:SGNH/GDSL hydrolase family protein n=1 Tax=Labilibaculum sp. TaxID=2060723 RepID=UPI0035697E26
MKRREFVKIIGVSTLGMGLVPSVFAAINLKKTDHDICKHVWEQLCGNIGNVYKTDAFKYIIPLKRKPNVLIYGDSVSIKYSSEVRESLEGKANVIRLFKNGGSSHNFIPNMEKMHDSMFQPSLDKGWNFKWDLIHFNVGLHDLKYLKGKHLSKEGTLVSSLSIYKKNLDGICKYLMLKFPKTKLVFATTTPVPENAKGRYQGDSIKYNKAALEVLVNYPNIVVNDLYTFTFPHHKEWMQEPGNVHYNEVGFAKQGKEVARIMAENLKI